MVDLQNARGTRDFAPEDKILRQDLVDSLRELFELYGFSPLETPLLERLDILASKYNVGEEIIKEIFTLKDQGERDLCLRYDLTVPLCRFVGMNRDLKMPFKRYAMGRVFRDGPIKTGRMREFFQCDIDIVGSSNMLADAQIVEVAQSFFEKLGLSVVIEINNRKLLDGILEQLRIPKEKQTNIILAIDKLKKIGLDDVEKELKEKGMLTDQVDELFKILLIKGSNLDKLEALRKILDNPKALEGLEELERMLSFIPDQSNILFSVCLARGLAYYTGTVFEVFLQDTSVLSSSLAAGGRYDNMISNFLDQEEKIPALGISFGIEPILEVLKKTGKISTKKNLSQVFVIPIKTQKESVAIAKQLRKSGIRTDIDLIGRGISKNLDYANSLGIPYVVIVGPKELEMGKVKLKNMVSGEEKDYPVDDVIQELLL